MAKRIGSRTIELTEDVRVAASAAVAGKKEGEGPLKDCFDYVSQDSYFAEDSWEKAETSMLRQCFGICRGKAGGAAFEPECVLGGDLLNRRRLQDRRRAHRLALLHGRAAVPFPA